VAVAGSAGLSERLTGFAYRVGWKLICRIPESWAKWAFTVVADIAWRRQGPKVQVLEGNLRRVLAFSGGSPDVDGKELRTLSRAALRSYARYWLEVFRLPAIPVERIVSGMHIDPAGEQAMFANLKAGRGVVIALPHMGNFEQAGAWVVARGLVHHRRRAAAAGIGVRGVRPVPREPGDGGPAADRRPQPVRDPGPAAARRRPGLPGQRP
jgi:KDO2-lipid IV(A) lauroyltransferase